MQRFLTITSLLFFFVVTLPSAAQTGITFTFDDGVVIPGNVDPLTPDSIRFYVLVQAGGDGTRMGDSQVYINYDNGVFGPSVVANANVRIEKGALIEGDLIPGLPLYDIVNTADNTDAKFAVTLGYNFEGSPAFGNLVAGPSAEPDTLLCITMGIIDGISYGITFDPALMDAQQFQSDNVGANKYDPVETVNNANLPVELVSFDATMDGQEVVLAWNTASETNSAGFDVERAAASGAGQSGVRWERLSFVDAAGTSSKTAAYSYRVTGLEVGTYRFRLKMIDLDGTFSYSDEIESSVEVPGEFLLSTVYPNPFNPSAQFSIAVRERQNVRIQAFDSLGRLVATLYDGDLAPNETHRFRFSGDNLASGLYLLRAVGDSFTSTRPMTLVK